MEFKYKINSRLLILLMLGAIMTCSSYLMFVYQPLQLIIKKVATLAPGSIFLKLWSVPPYNVYIDAFIFNVTNAEEFLSGKEKMKVQEVGPYVYQEILLNKNATFNPNGTMTFEPKRYLKFRPDMSIGNPDVDWIISPNIPLLGITASLRDSGFITNLAVSTISNALNSKSFLNVTISQYLWGYDDKLVTLAHKALPNWINFDRFGILDRLMALDNATNVVTLNMQPELGLASPLLTEKERSSVYHIHRWNGSPGLKHWGYTDENQDNKNSRCNMVEGAFEGTVFPPNMPENTSVKLYRRAFCRPVPFNYKGKAETKTGFRGMTFEVDKLFLATPEENPDNHCYCPKDGCLPKGLGSLSPCYYDMPIAISQPHFLNSDPLLLEQIEGLKPDEEKHDSSFLLHPELGVAMEASLRIQINLDIGQTKYNPRTKPFNGMYLPLFWLQLRLGEIPGSINALITVLFYVLPVVQEVLIYLLGLGGLALMSGSALFSLFFSKEQPNGRLSFRGEYSPIPIIPINSPYFKPDIRILK
ncbi:scavenger receptor class B member 1-like isoform X1 [Tribolium madens]|uniref:scavenger receptor class B member 1-like isoform X1 n=2 Tax=Tribolium madens TaxID=41895 RepID=UPI001CF72420|nr:scavenger receptor class B member 1-like isoform X1 [Tribolium madens]